jgi:hypothetical protein
VIGEVPCSSAVRGRSRPGSHPCAAHPTNPVKSRPYRRVVSEYRKHFLFATLSVTKFSMFVSAQVPHRLFSRYPSKIKLPSNLCRGHGVLGHLGDVANQVAQTESVLKLRFCCFAPHP